MKFAIAASVLAMTASHLVAADDIPVPGYCDFEQTVPAGLLRTAIDSRFVMRSNGTVPDVPGICGGLWDNLKRWAACDVDGAATHYCKDIGGGVLELKFKASVWCDQGMGESAWWHATRNHYGVIDC